MGVEVSCGWRCPVSGNGSINTEFGFKAVRKPGAGKRPSHPETKRLGCVAHGVIRV